MEFKNISGKDVKIRVGDRENAIWKTVKVGGIVDISEKLGINNNFEKVIDNKEFKEEIKEKVDKKPKSKNK